MSVSRNMVGEFKEPGIVSEGNSRWRKRNSGGV